MEQPLHGAVAGSLPKKDGKDHMAEYHLHAKTHSRGAGKGAGGHARYILRQGPYSKRTVEVMDGATVQRVEVSRADEVVFEKSAHLPAWAQTPAAYWDAADQYERANGTVYREIEFALPKELSDDENHALAHEFAEQLSRVSGGHTPYTLAIHRSETKPMLLHCHLMLSDKVNDGLARDPSLWFRRASNPGKDPARGGAPKTQARIGRDWLGEMVRPLWAQMANTALARAEVDARIDHRTLEARRMEQEALAAQAKGEHHEIAARQHARAAEALDRPPEPKKGRVLTHAGPEKAPGRAAMVVDFEAAKAERARAAEVRRLAEAAAERDRQAVERAQERREAARREFENNHGGQPDTLSVTLAVAALVATQAQRARQAAQERWTERRRRATRREREARRERLVALADALAKDQACRLPLRQAYLDAGYGLQQQGDKGVFVYPHDDLQAERKAVSNAWQTWDQRKQGLKRDRATEEETRPGIRHPDKPRWQAERERILTQAYNADVAEKMGRWYRVESGPDGITLSNREATITDYGDRITSKDGNGREIEAMVDLARAKGWERVSLTGTAEFQERAARAFVEAGIGLTDARLEQTARDAIEADRRKAVREQVASEHAAQEREAMAAQARTVERAKKPPSTEVVPGIRYLVEETADHAPYKDKHGEVMLFESEAQALEFRTILRGTYPIVRIAVDPEPQKAPVVDDDIEALERAGTALLGLKKPTQSAPVVERERPSVPVQKPVQVKPAAEPVKVPEKPAPDPALRRDPGAALVASVRDRDMVWHNLSVYEKDGQLTGTLQRHGGSSEALTFKAIDGRLKAVGPEHGVTLAPREDGTIALLVFIRDAETGKGKQIHEHPGRLRANEALQKIPDHREGKLIEQALGVNPKALNPVPAVIPRRGTKTKEIDHGMGR